MNCPKMNCHDFRRDSGNRLLAGHTQNRAERMISQEPYFQAMACLFTISSAFATGGSDTITSVTIPSIPR